MITDNYQRHAKVRRNRRVHLRVLEAATLRRRVRRYPSEANRKALNRHVMQAAA